jgi:hypothetical protein
MATVMKRAPGLGGFLLLSAAAAVLCACIQPNLPEDPYKDLPSKSFYAFDYTKPILGTGRYVSYELEAVKLAERPGSVVVYGERTVKVSLEDAEKIADEFDHILTVIYPVFGEPLDYYQDGMITLLLLDIKDGAEMNDGYYAGYFDPNDMSRKSESNKYTNEMDMLYLDVVQGGLKREDFFATIAHELQHLIRYSAYLEEETGAYPDIWINEGLSLAAEYVYWSKRKETDVLDNYYVDSFNGKDRESKIPEGNNFFVWLDDDYVLDEYASAYFFFQWLRIQADNDIAVYQDIISSINSGNRGYKAVLEAVKERIDPGIDSWEVLIRTWLLANYVKAPSGIHGYNGKFPDLTIFSSGKEKLNLYPGEGVYSKFQGDEEFTPPPQENSDHIRYVGVTNDGFSAEPPYTGTWLLTFNSNEDKNDSREWGHLTGLGDTPVSGQTSRQSSGGYPPYRINPLPALPDPGQGPARE